ncbi:hypothetical protein SynBIOSU31_02688 [Synechococcus sp. BIOS-U3-1]|uniref:hypothetical protein n=1 Tax=Synechococcus sp. BIOS-U3-1 TaxID=1400865 RepID=UPI001646F376|nr:hypothetical protein [Synechococcus sp. BIOS-U3-1]QNI59550.1 hypothetical protein SynBIOSU31_02688 [Synechococcus sp. BIOS-U3-1]
MDLSQLSALVLVVVGAVLFVTAVQLFTLWASEAVLASAKVRLDESLQMFRRSIPSFSLRRRKAA